MNKISRGSIVCVLTCAVALCQNAALSHAARPEQAHSYEQPSPDGKYIFVMLAKSRNRGASIDTLNKKYKHSGLYKTGGPAKALWTVNWYAPQVHVSSDGKHLVRIGRKALSSINKQPDMTQLALAFYENGKVLSKYLIEDLVQDPNRLTKSGDSFLWSKRIAFDDASGRLSVTLVTGQDVVFNVKSGKIISIKAGTGKKRRKG